MRFPRKIKKRLKKIPYTGFCYGGSFGDKGKRVNGKRAFKQYICTYYSKSGTHCALINNQQHTDIEEKTWEEYALKDQTAICRLYPLVKSFLKP